MNSPWRCILCVVDLDAESGNALTTAAGSVLRYATALAVTHRARLTALQISPPESLERSAVDRLRKIVRVAREIHADLIVVGGGGHNEPMSRMCEALRRGPCPVLIVHPSGRAAVA